MILYSVGEVIIFEHGCYISAVEYVRMLILSSYVLLASCITVTEFFFKTDLPDRASTMYNLLARRTNALARILHELSLHY